MNRDSLAADWNWDNPAECTRWFDAVRAESALCDKLQQVPVEPPFSRRQLLELGVTGIEFAAFQTGHPTGLAADCIPIRSKDAAASLHRIFRVDGESHFIQLDISEPLPFQDGCVDWVYAEHLIEHVSPDTAIAWLRETRRILAPGGLLRLTTPDLRKYAKNYLDDSGFFAEHRERMLDVVAPAPGMPDRPAFMFNQISYFYGHQWIYDIDEIRHALRSAGFEDDAVKRCAFRQGASPQVAGLDRSIRNDETIYVEANA